MSRLARPRGRSLGAVAAIAGLLCLSTMPVAWAAPPPPMDAIMKNAQAIPHFRTPRPGLMTAGQPAPADWETLAALGTRTVVNLRTAEEMAGRDEAAEASASGLTHVALPVDGAAGVTRDKATVLWSLVEDAPGTLLVHCASGNRVGALLAVGAATEGGMPLEEAIAFGRSAGLDSLEPRVRELLATPAP